jgi:hypothetical protein
LTTFRIFPKVFGSCDCRCRRQRRRVRHKGGIHCHHRFVDTRA